MMSYQGIYRQRGFTLLEVIVAFSILAMALTLLLGTMSGATRQIRRADHDTYVTLQAQSMMAQWGVGEQLQPGRYEGVVDNRGYRWILDVQSYIDPLLAGRDAAGKSAHQLMQLDLTIYWGDGDDERLHWQTLRLVPSGEF